VVRILRELVEVIQFFLRVGHFKALLLARLWLFCLLFLLDVPCAISVFLRALWGVGEGGGGGVSSYAGCTAVGGLLDVVVAVLACTALNAEPAKKIK
jgi:hypothetical protein